jgi:hypothetical protein
MQVGAIEKGRKKLSLEEKKKRYNTGLCLRCGKQGYFARECKEGKEKHYTNAIYTAIIRTLAKERLIVEEIL